MQESASLTRRKSDALLRTPIGAVFALDYRNFLPVQVQLYPSALNALVSSMAGGKGSSGFLVGRVLKDSLQNVLVVDRYDEGVRGCPSLVMPNDVILAVVGNASGLEEPTATEQLMGLCAMSVKLRNYASLSIKTWLPGLSFTVTPIKSLRIKQNALSGLLLVREQRTKLSETQGLVTAEDGGTFALVSSKSLDSVTSLAGLWISNAEKMDTFQIYARLLSFAKKHEFLEQFFVILFPREVWKPLCFSCTASGSVSNIVTKFNSIDIELSTSSRIITLNQEGLLRAPNASAVAKDGADLFVAPLPKVLKTVAPEPAKHLNPEQGRLKDSNGSTSIPAQFYIQLLQQQIEMITKNCDTTPPSLASSHHAVGVNTSTYDTRHRDISTNTSVIAQPTSVTSSVQTSFLEAKQPPRNAANTTLRYVPLMQCNNDGTSDAGHGARYDEEEIRFNEEVCEEGYTSVSLVDHVDEAKLTLSENEQRAQNSLDWLLKNVDNALRENKTFDVSSPSSFEPRTMEAGLNRRLSMPDAVSISPFVAKNIGEIRSTEKKFILVDDAPLVKPVSSGRPPVFESSTRPQQNHSKQQKPAALSFAGNGPASDYGNDISIVSSILSEKSPGLFEASIEKINDVSEEEHSCYENFSFASLEYLRKHNLM